MKYRLAIFDFDGVLADSFPFFASVFNELADRHGFERIEPSMVSTLRGYEARQIMKHVGLPVWKLPLVARHFTELVKANAQRIPLFPHVEEVLLHLSQAGVRLAIVSSNAYDNVVRILGERNAALIGYFECGMSIFGKASRIRNVLGKARIPNHQAIYIADQLTDREAAREGRIAFGAVSWGYGTMESLCKEAPEEMFQDVLEIKRIA